MIQPVDASQRKEKEREGERVEEMDVLAFTTTFCYLGRRYEEERKRTRTVRR